MDESSKDIQIELLNAQIEKLEADVRSERSASWRWRNDTF